MFRLISDLDENAGINPWLLNLALGFCEPWINEPLKHPLTTHIHFLSPKGGSIIFVILKAVMIFDL